MTLLNYLPDPVGIVVYAAMIAVGIWILAKILGDIQ